MAHLLRISRRAFSHKNVRNSVSRAHDKQAESFFCLAMASLTAGLDEELYLPLPTVQANGGRLENYICRCPLSKRMGDA
jgi:hypothetical protein